MAKLYFHYSTMNAGKSTLLLQASHNYYERGMQTYLLAATFDTRAGTGRIGSRIGLSADADMFTPSEDFQYELQQFRIDWNSSQVLIGGYIAWDGFGMKRFIKHLKDS